MIASACKAALLQIEQDVLVCNIMYRLSLAVELYYPVTLPLIQLFHVWILLFFKPS